MDLEGIRLLLRVAELGSVQRAAQILGLSRTSLRRRLENLEAEIGGQLLIQGTSGVTLTPAGSVVVEEGRELLERASRMVASATSAKSQVAGRIRLLIPVGLPDAPHVAVIRMLHTLWPGLCVQEAEYMEPLDHLHEPFDLMIHFGEPPLRGAWFSRVLLRARLVPLASEAYLAQYGTPTSPAELAGHRLLVWTAARVSPREWPLWSGGVMPIEAAVSSADGQLLHRAAQDGVGILLGNPDASILPTSTPLIPVLDKVIGKNITLRALSPVPGDVAPRTRAVLESLQGFLASLQTEG